MPNKFEEPSTPDIQDDDIQEQENGGQRENVVDISSKTEIREDNPNGGGRFAIDNISENEIILKFKGEIIDHPTATSIQVDVDKHLEMGRMTYINHSCGPNTYINYEDFTLRTLRPIEEGGRDYI